MARWESATAFVRYLKSILFIKEERIASPVEPDMKAANAQVTKKKDIRKRELKVI